jgi:hypothetical protein
MTLIKSGAAIVLILCTAACASTDTEGRNQISDEGTAPEQYAFRTPPMDPSRRVSVQDCRNRVIDDGANLLCLRTL